MKPSVEGILGRLQGVPRGWVLGLGVTYMLLLGVLDCVLPAQFSVTLFYFLGVVFVGWCGSKSQTCALSFLSVLMLLFREWVFRSPESNSGWLLLWNAGTRLVLFCGSGWLAVEAGRLTRHQATLLEQLASELRDEAEKHAKTSAQLAESLERFEQVASNISEVFWLTDMATKQPIYVSPGYKAVWGRSPEELYGKSRGWLPAVHPDDRERVSTEMQAQEESGAYDLEYRLIRPDGEMRWIRDRGFPVTDSQGRIYRMAGIAEDITDRKLAEQSLAAREQHTRSILAMAMDGFLEMDSRNRLLEVNEAYCRITGYTRDELLNSRARALENHPIPMQVAAQRGNLLGSGQACFELRFPHASGRDVYVEISVACLPDSADHVVGFMREITGRKRAEEALRESEERYRTLAESSPDAIFIVDRQLNVQYVNSAGAHLWGRPPQELLASSHVAADGQEPLVETQALEFARQHTRTLIQALETGTVFRRDELIPLPTGDRWIETRLVPMRGNGGSAQAVMGVSRDITERKRAELLLQAQRDVASRLSLTSDLPSALRGLLDIAVHIEGIDSGGIYLMDPVSRHLAMAAHTGLSPAFVAGVARYAAGSAEARLVAGGLPSYVLRDDLPGTSELIRAEGLRALAILPLCYEGEVLGTLNLASHTHSDIPTQTRVVVEAIAAQASGAIARIRAEEALLQSEQRLRTIITSAPVILFAGDAQATLTFEEGQALKAIGVQPGANVGRPVAEAYAASPAILENVRRVLAGEEFSSIVDLKSLQFDCRYTPTRDKDGNVTGYIGVATNITDRHRLEREILEISDREQARIGQDIHDGLCQQLVSLAFDANSLETQLSRAGRPEAATARRIADYLDQAITESRQVSRGLFPIRLETEGLLSALEELCSSTADRFQIHCRFECEDDLPGWASHTLHTHLYRIAQEAVSNAVKHARASHILVRLQGESDGLQLRIEDDGTGLAPEAQRNPAGMGLKIMDYRARRIGGNLHIGTGRPGGTAVSCRVPIRGRGRDSSR